MKTDEIATLKAEVAELKMGLAALLARHENLSEVATARADAIVNEQRRDALIQAKERDRAAAKQAQASAVRRAEELGLEAVEFGPTKTDGSIRRTMTVRGIRFDTYEGAVVVDRETRAALDGAIAAGHLVARPPTAAEIAAWLHARQAQ